MVSNIVSHDMARFFAADGDHKDGRGQQHHSPTMTHSARSFTISSSPLGDPEP